MDLLTFPKTDQAAPRLVFYLAAEEWLVSRAEEAVFFWQTRPTVIYGHNQKPEQEFDIEFCRDNGIEFYRRKSGGGCVYSDDGNLMISRVTRRSGNVEDVFSDFLDCLSRALRSLGLEAVVTQHNDVLVDSRKVSGNAFYRAPKGDIVHGTLLLNSDFAQLSRVLTPPLSKLEKHAVRSVRQRVANLSEFGDFPLPCVLNALSDSFGATSRRTLTASELLEIAEIEKGYLL